MTFFNGDTGRTIIHNDPAIALLPGLLDSYKFGLFVGRELGVSILIRVPGEKKSYFLDTYLAAHFGNLGNTDEELTVVIYRSAIPLC